LLFTNNILFERLAKELMLLDQSASWPQGPYQFVMLFLSWFVSDQTESIHKSEINCSVQQLTQSGHKLLVLVLVQYLLYVCYFCNTLLKRCHLLKLVNKNEQW